MDIPQPYLLFLGDAADDNAAKTAWGIMDWRPDWCIGQYRFANCRTRLSLPDMSITEAVKAGAKTLVIGIVNPGGAISQEWEETLLNALAQGLHIASGLHQSLSSIPVIAEAAQRHGRQLFDVRQSERTFATGTGIKRRGLRLLTVGTDCAVGKKYTALAIEREMIRRGINAQFRATGQTGILIAGNGVAIDAVVADFIAGAAEWISPDNTLDHWDIIEGQGSLFHPAYAGVSLGLLHGSQPDVIVLCHEPTRTHMRSVEYPVPDLRICLERNLDFARVTNPAVRCAGIAVNTAYLDRKDVNRILSDISDTTSLPALDPLKDGVDAIVDGL